MLCDEVRPFMPLLGGMGLIIARLLEAMGLPSPIPFMLVSD